MVTNKIYFMHQFDFLCNFYQSMYPIPIQNHMQWWLVEIKESSKYKLYDNWKFNKNNLLIFKQWHQEEPLGYVVFILPN